LEFESLNMRVLILGGTQFVGRHIVEALLANEYNVSIFTRGITPDELPAEVERIRGDRDEGSSGLKALKERNWDVCVDVSGFTTRQVRPSAEMLYRSVKRYVFMSAVSVYGDPEQHPVLETHSLMPPAAEDIIEINSETYGSLKVTCESIVRQIYGDRCTILRPQIVAGPYDPFDRFSYWVRRSMQGGEMFAPGDGNDHLQVIDAHDLAKFVVNVISNNIEGTFNLSGHRITWTQYMKVLGAMNFIWVPAGIIKSAGLTESELPLFRQEHSPRSSLMDVSNEKAKKAGLELSEFEVTIRNIRAWLPQCKLIPAMSHEREAELIRIAHKEKARENS
jgi:2'-hydroxyisoflavone reductase